MIDFEKFGKIFSNCDSDTYYPLIRSISNDSNNYIGTVAVDENEIYLIENDVMTTIFYGFTI